MNAKYVQKGSAVDYTPTTDVAAGDVVIQGDLVGVAKLDIASGDLGALTVNGVFDIAKGTGAVTVGAPVYWDSTNENITTTATDNVYVGKCILAAASDDDVVRVLLNAPYVAVVTEDADEG